MQLPLFDARMLGPLVGYLQRHGVNPGTYLDRERIPGEIVIAGGWITKKQAYDLVYAVTEEQHCPEAIFAAYDDFRLDDLGPIAVAIGSCRTVKEALEVTTRLGSMAYEGNQYFLDIDGDTTWLSYKEPKAISAGQELINDMTLAVYRRLISLFADPDFVPQRARTQGVDRHRQRGVRSFDDCQITSHCQSTGLAFPTALLSKRLSLKPTELNKNRCEDWEPGPENEGDFVNALHRVIVSRSHYSHLPTLREVARLAGISPATIKRHLSTSGITYKVLLDRIRFDAADEMLLRSELSVKEIARELGFSSTSNFVRTFRRFAAMTPKAYRERFQTC